MPVRQRLLVCPKFLRAAFDCFSFRFAARITALVLALQMLILPSPVSAAAIG